ncbi:hypothetical protein Ddye_013166 [Dipteronia dyeriana]|uniref:RNase H type-1 domain-containing protein n=1 Tax=Dipteronia dyeriana TaxID=168575 RepID=A0AAD9X5N3_9ROSI|nr:hypothetical protein Ddye_013166 [Dipteronia dyeriana]
MWNDPTRGMPGPAGIGGILRNLSGKFLCLFSFIVGMQDSNTAELLVIQKAYDLCASSSLLIDTVSDSMITVSWVNNSECYGSLQNINIFYNNRGCLQQLKGLSVIFNSRIANSLADSLAKSGSNGSEDRLEWLAP